MEKQNIIQNIIIIIIIILSMSFIGTYLFVSESTQKITGNDVGQTIDRFCNKYELTNNATNNGNEYICIIDNETAERFYCTTYVTNNECWWIR